MIEGQELDKKSLLLITGKSTNWNELAKDCICFANSKGGLILIGIEDSEDFPRANQRINPQLPDKILRTISQRTINVAIVPEIKTAENGGEYIEIKVLRNEQAIASTSDGKYYARIADECKPIMPEAIARLAAEKNAFVWEIQTNQKVPGNKIEEQKLDDFIKAIKNSGRVSNFVKEKTVNELLEYYLFLKGEYLTNLGILWIGQREDRAILLHAPCIQFIKYNERDEKIKKIVWDDFYLNPVELLNAVLTEIPEWKETIEISDGILRKNIPFYDEIVIRELIANALVHRVYTMRGDIFINLYPNRLEVHSPGLLPWGVTPKNIISQSVRRNEHLAKVFYDLRLMEREGSGYDKIYEVLLSEGKQIPVVEEKSDRVKVTVFSPIFNKEAIRLIEKANTDFPLKQKELICLGLIALNNSLSAVELANILDVKEKNGMRGWLGKLPRYGLVLSKGKTKGTEYFINPEFLRQLGFKGKTNLKTIEPYRLRELIIQDLKVYPNSSIGLIQERIGKEIPTRKIRAQLEELVKKGIVDRQGTFRHTKYFFGKKNIEMQ
jgi:ATP-dependent DNA helicase RecG